MITYWNWLEVGGYSSRLRGGKENPETELAVAEVRRVVGAVRRTTAVGEHAPSAAADHPERARFSPLRIDGDSTGMGSHGPILTPLPHVPMHVVQPPRVGRITADLNRPSQPNSTGIVTQTGSSDFLVGEVS